MERNNGPTDVVACKDYQIKWIIAGKKLFESGSSILELSSGKEGYVRFGHQSLHPRKSPASSLPPPAGSHQMVS